MVYYFYYMFAGRFGKVYQLDTPYSGYKAVLKVYMAKDKKFWDQERQVFSQPHMSDHDNIVRFLGAVTVGDDFAVVLEYYDTSLTTYLKGELFVVLKIPVSCHVNCWPWTKAYLIHVILGKYIVSGLIPLLAWICYNDQIFWLADK